MRIKVTRSIAPVQWFGGKGQALGILRRHVPPGGRPYCEPYMGGASLFFDRRPAPLEVLNDLNGDLVNLFRCLQDPARCAELERRIRWTLYARAEFERALEILRSPTTDPIERAWALFVATNQGFSGRGATAGDWGRSFISTNGMGGHVSKWQTRQSLFRRWHARLARAYIEQRDALYVIEYWDNPDAVFYVDPPYHHDTRTSADDYEHEADHDHHRRLVEVLLRCRGAVVLSGYEHPVYAPLLEAGWACDRYARQVDAAGRTRASQLRGEGAASALVPRIECVWSNPRALEMLRDHRGAMLHFDEPIDENESTEEEGEIA